MRLAGVEPAAQSLGNSCSIQVSYRRVFAIIILLLPTMRNPGARPPLFLVEATGAHQDLFNIWRGLASCAGGQIEFPGFTPLQI